MGRIWSIVEGAMGAPRMVPSGALLVVCLLSAPPAGSSSFWPGAVLRIQWRSVSGSRGEVAPRRGSGPAAGRAPPQRTTLTLQLRGGYAGEQERAEDLNGEWSDEEKDDGQQLLMRLRNIEGKKITIEKDDNEKEKAMKQVVIDREIGACAATHTATMLR
jgi:hypothetical protein